MPSAGHNATICTCSTMQMSSSQWHCMTHNVMLQLGLYRRVVGMSALQPRMSLLDLCTEAEGLTCIVFSWLIAVLFTGGFLGCTLGFM